MTMVPIHRINQIKSTPPLDAPLLSIIIDNYNYGHFIAHAIDSALRQTWTSSEVIVVDDGSTDNSREIILSYGDRIRPIFKENGGQASAFNAGFDASRGLIIIFLDSDDVLLPETGQRVVDAFQQSRDASKVMYRMEIVDASGRPTGFTRPPRHIPLQSGNFRHHVLSFPFDMTWTATSGNAFRAEVLRKIFPIPEQDYGILADFYLSHLTALFGDVVVLDQTGALYRVHRSNAVALAAPKLNLQQLREVIAYSQRTEKYIESFATQYRLRTDRRRQADALSVSLIAYRLISVKLDPRGHPIRGDRKWDLFWLGARATFRRFDVNWPLKLVFLLWFAAMLIAPNKLALWLANQFYFPENRTRFNGLLGALHLSRNFRLVPRRINWKAIRNLKIKILI